MNSLNVYDLHDGFPLIHLVVEFNIKEGLSVTERIVKVTNRDNVKPSAGCDCIIDGSSTNSKNIFEIGGIDGVLCIETIIFSLKNSLKIKLSTYCLLENVNTVKVELVEHVKNGVAQFVREQAEFSAKISGMVASCG